MITGKDLKQLVRIIPDDAVVMVNDNWNVSVEAVNVETTVDGWIASLKLTEGFSVTSDKVLDEIFIQLKTKRKRWPTLRR